MNKYRNIKVKYDGVLFDSKKERDYYIILKHKQKKGEIKGFEIQVKFQLLPSQKDVVTGKTIERPVNFKLDFVVWLNSDEIEYIDVKSPPTRKEKSYVIVRKLMLFIHGIRIKEV